jgi:hypothetical protein
MEDEDDDEACKVAAVVADLLAVRFDEEAGVL